MRILQLKTSADRGGAETILIQTTQGLVERGHDVRTIVGESGWLLDRLKAESLDASHLPLSSASGIFQVPALVRHVKGWKADVIVSHGARVNVFSAITSMITGCPTVAIEHNVDDWRDSGWLMNRVDRWVARVNRGRIAVSEAVGGMLLEQQILSADKVVVVPNGVRFPKPKRQPDRSAVLTSVGVDPKATVIVVVARFAPQKGHIHLIEALSKLVAGMPELVCLLVGDGPLRSDIEERVRLLGLEQHVVFAGAVDHVMELLPACDLFVLPSLWEGLPISVIEAMGMGVPVVATAVAGTPEIVIDGKTGLLVPPADPGALAEAIRRLLGDPALRSEIAAQGRAHARSRFGLDRVLDEYEEVLERWRRK